MLSSSGYWVFSQPEICFGDQSRSVYSQRCSATSRGWKEGSAWAARPTARLLRPLDWLDMQGGHHDVATSRLTVDTAASKHLAISRFDAPEASPREISSRSRSVSARSARRRYCRSNPTVTRHQTTNGGMSLPKARRSHATSAPTSNDATHRSSAPLKAQTVSLVS